MIDRVKALTNEQLREITLNGLQSNILLELLSEIKEIASKQYKEMVQIGYSKMLPQIALGHS